MAYRAKSDLILTVQTVKYNSSKLNLALRKESAIVAGPVWGKAQPKLSAEHHRNICIGYWSIVENVAPK